MKKPFEELNVEKPDSDFPKIVTNLPLSLFYKRKTAEKVLYTMVQDEQMKSFETADYQRLHQDADFELMYILTGELTLVLNDQEFIFTA